MDDLVSAIRRGESRSLVLRGEAGIGGGALGEGSGDGPKRRTGGSGDRLAVGYRPAVVEW